MSLAPPDLLRFAYLSLKGNPVRSLLSTLGVFMGVFAVSATLEARNLGQAFLSQQLSQREAPRINIYWDWNSSAESFSFRDSDIEILQQRLVGWRSISGERWGVWNGTVLFEDKEAPANLRPVSINYLDTSGYRLLSGRFFTSSDIENYRAVAVIDTLLAEDLFGGDTAVGRQIYFSSTSYLVIGVVNSFEDEWGDEPRGLVLISLAMDTALTGRDTLSRILIRPTNIDALEAVGEQAVQILSQEHIGQDFFAWSNIFFINEQRKTLRTVSLILLALGGIALTVGGVGIANITIASTVERTSEIGLRRAIGATRQEILVQFVLEAVMISCVGGVVAIATTQSIAFVVAQTFELPYQLNIGTSLMALGSAVVVGVGSSFIPALQASQLDPVNALRT
ncbi:MAG: FtsX-like permease family protein [Cyanothece sp. SIO2G6]|nr:FtsX-like permease family protein [Cyanothece sp. SIO2G6]